jgi:copper(I)-binding protein
MKKLEPGGMHTVALDILAPFAVGDEKAFVLEFTDMSTTEITAPVEMAPVSDSEG